MKNTRTFFTNKEVGDSNWTYRPIVFYSLLYEGGSVFVMEVGQNT